MTRSIDLNKITLGQRFATQTVESFWDFVHSLKIEKPQVAPRAPKVKKTKQSHDVSTNGICLRCERRPRKPTAVCDGKKKPPKDEIPVDVDLTCAKPESA